MTRLISPAPLLRLSLAFTVIVVAACSPALHADERPQPKRSEPKVEFDVSRTGKADSINVAIKITRTDDNGITTTLSSPRILMSQGRRAQVIIETAKPRPKPGADAAPAAAAPDEEGSGIRVDVVSVAGTDDLLALTTLTEDGAVVWAQATTAKIKPKPDPAAR